MKLMREAAVCLACAFGGCHGVASPERVGASDAMHWRGEGASIEVRVRNGSVHARLSEDEHVTIAARSRIEGARLRVESTGGALVACVARAEGCDAFEGHVDVDVRVPRGVAFAGYAANGDIEATPVESDVEAHAQNGSIVIATSGVARASTVNGSIDASIGAETWDGVVSIETVNGDIAVKLREGANGKLRTRSVNGGVSILSARRPEGGRIYAEARSPP